MNNLLLTVVFLIVAGGHALSADRWNRPPGPRFRSARPISTRRPGRLALVLMVMHGGSGHCCAGAVTGRDCCAGPDCSGLALGGVPSRLAAARVILAGRSA